MATKSFDKMVEEIGSMSVLDLSKLVKALEETFGVSAAMPMAVAGAAPAADAGSAAPAQAEEKSEYKVTLKESGAEKIKVIKALRAVAPELTLTDAKKAVEEAPSVIAEAASKDLAQKMKKELEAAGAKVELS
jgi:large subunit ribosomal protein L7/L12